MQVFDFEEYKPFVLQWIKAQPSSGRGQLSRLAEELNSSSVVMSQVFNGPRDLSSEQALGVASYLGLSELEIEYFMLLVQRARAGTAQLSSHLTRQILKLKEQSRQIGSRIAFESFSKEAKAQFYSSWAFSAVRLGLAIPKTTLHTLAETLGLDRSQTAEISDFLLKYGLLTKGKNGFELGPAATHIAHNHPLVERHHLNWRVKALESLRFTPRENAEDLHYTGPMLLSHSLAMELRAELMALLARLHKKIPNAPNEQVHCLNIDWFRLC
jgi:uncharacterized protein (TIGR02147 family)